MLKQDPNRVRTGVALSLTAATFILTACSTNESDGSKNTATLPTKSNEATDPGAQRSETPVAETTLGQIQNQYREAGDAVESGSGLWYSDNSKTPGHTDHLDYYFKSNNLGESLSTTWSCADTQMEVFTGNNRETLKVYPGDPACIDKNIRPDDKIENRPDIELIVEAYEL